MMGPNNPPNVPTYSGTEAQRLRLRVRSVPLIGVRVGLMSLYFDNALDTKGMGVEGTCSC